MQIPVWKVNSASDRRASRAINGIGCSIPCYAMAALEVVTGVQRLQFGFRLLRPD